MICFIPTKNRVNTKTYKLFNEVGIEVKHFIEPQEIDLYTVPNKVSILENDKGIGYVRQFMLDYAKSNNFEWVLFCDDDVNSFGLYNGKTHKKLFYYKAKKQQYPQQRKVCVLQSFPLPDQIFFSYRMP